MNSKLVTALVVFGGLAALAVATKFGAPDDAIKAVGALLVVLAGSLKGFAASSESRP